jgi:hypothetical protein
LFLVVIALLLSPSSLSLSFSLQPSSLIMCVSHYCTHFVNSRCLLCVYCIVSIKHHHTSYASNRSTVYINSTQ